VQLFQMFVSKRSVVSTGLSVDLRIWKGSLQKAELLNSGASLGRFNDVTRVAKTDILR